MKATCSSYGLARSEAEESQDSYAVQLRDDLIIAVVADGVGTAQQGREAAARIVATLIDNFKSRPKSWSVPKALEEFARLINRALHQESLARFDAPELLSTVAVVVIDGDRLYGLNVGDSRAYLWHQEKLLQLSQDHVEADPQLSHALTRAMGMEPDVVPHCFEHAVKAGDMLWLCTDGAYQLLPEAEIPDLMRSRAGARSLITNVRARAKPETLDDMSAVVVDIVSTEGSNTAGQTRLEVPGELRRGDVIDGYKLVEPLQQNERTWIADYHKGRVVLKFAPLAAQENDAVLNQFVREMWNITRLKADYFPVAFCPENTRHMYYGMELIEAPTLKQALQNGPLKIDEGIALGAFLLNVCQYLLRFDLIHGDIKPENILVLKGTAGVSFKLVDFGSMSEIFSTTSRAGTPSYLAPERFNGAANTERTELFAIGVTVYHALTRELPYGEIEPFQNPVFGKSSRPSGRNPNIPPWLEAVILRAIAAAPDSRYLNYSEMRYELSHPEKVKPFVPPNAPLMERNPLLFYKVGFFLMLIINVYLWFRLLGKH